MDKATAQAMVTQMFQQMDPDLEYAMRHTDFVADMPQSGERFTSRGALREMQRAFPDPPRITLRRIVGDGDVWSPKRLRTTAASASTPSCSLRCGTT